ncbi:MAG TPA: hypothetical protein VGY56_19925 [Verrucomicrobiae bacterium]|nr:hypothetical protein [Verrucomicrobiae bacterium]
MFFVQTCLHFEIDEERKWRLNVNMKSDKWDFTANSSDELAKVGTKLLKARNQNFLDEQVQMTRFLEAASSSQIFQYPVRVRHEGEVGVPDFQIKSGGRRIAIELAKVTTQDVEHARALQRKGIIKRTLNASSLFRRGPTARTKNQVIQEGFSIRPFVLDGVSPAELDAIWIQEIRTQIDEKTVVLQRSNFQHGDEDWLLLWDLIGTDESELKPRMEAVRNLLAPRWNPGWYSHVFVQEIEFPAFLAIFSDTGLRSIPEDFKMPEHNYPPGFLFEGSAEDYMDGHKSRDMIYRFCFAFRQFLKLLVSFFQRPSI